VAAIKFRLKSQVIALARAYRQLVRSIRPRVTQRQSLQPASPSLQALTAAALALPGLMMTSPNVAAQDNEATFQYGYYDEGKRRLFGNNNKLDPIHVDTLNTTGSINLFDRVKFGFNYVQDTWSGATPVATATRGFMSNLVSGASSHVNTGYNYVDKNFNRLEEVYNETTGEVRYVKNKQDQQLVHMMTSASPETRKQADFKLGYEWNEAALDLGGGVSVEPDYNSSFVNSNGRWDFNQKLTTLNLGLSYTNSSVNAQRDPNASGYVDYSSQSAPGTGLKDPITGERQDWSTHLGLSQVLNKNAVLDGSFSYTRSTGFLENPYKTSTFIFKDPVALDYLGVPGVYNAEIINVLENRPNVRNQFTWDMRYTQYVNPLNAALHFDYRFFHDNWGINAHTFDAAWDQPVGHGWTVTPRVRYYSQDAADFYQPIFYFNEVKPTRKFGRIDFNKLPISNFSSDQRLSGYGALSGGVTVSKQFAKGISVNAGFEYYTHQGALKLGGGGEGNYADFNYYMINAALNVNLSALSFAGSGDSSHSEHHDHSQHSSHAPAGVMFDHMIGKAGGIMTGYRYMYGRQAGDMLHGVNPVSDKTIANNACGKGKCELAPAYMDMHMHMLDLMYAPTDWLNLMLMPQFMDMDMSLRTLKGVSPVDEHHHDTGGVGDTGMYALFKIFNNPGHHLHTALGFSAPTGDVGIMLRPGGHHGGPGGFIHYGMQLGSGTWDFKPSITYTGQQNKWSWGAQLNGTLRMEDRNASGFAFGDIFQSTAWGSYNLLNWLSTSVRAVYTEQGKVRGGFNGIHPTDGSVDFAKNYGGHYWDVGFGINASIPSGELAGNRFSFEWLEPVEDKVNGYQLEREGALSATWSYAF